jgi:hypothetical protein
MRAMKGMRIQKDDQNGRNRFYASALRCVDIPDKSIFIFNNK